MDALISKVQRVAAELDEIRNALPQQEQAGVLDLDLLNSFKASVDHMRHVLWAYIEALTTSGDVDRTLQHYRLQRATEMLRQLREHGPVEATTPQASNFLQEIQAIADSALKRHAHDKD